MQDVKVMVADSWKKPMTMGDFRTLLQWMKSIKSEWFIKRDVTRYLKSMNNSGQLNRVFAIAARSKGNKNTYECQQFTFDKFNYNHENNNDELEFFET